MTAMTVAAAALIGSALVAGAQENYPTKPIRVIVPEVVGSAADLMSRIIGQRIGEALGQPVTYENLFLEAGVEKGIKAAPDGYTLMYGSVRQRGAAAPCQEGIVRSVDGPHPGCAFRGPADADCEQSGTAGQHVARTGRDDEV
jgi:tripartite-type tricarboxylate transporter receptor subunit TctC